MESYKEKNKNHLQQTGNEYYDYHKKMKGHDEDAAENPSSFMTF